MSMQVLLPGLLLEKFDSYVSAIALRLNVNNEESCICTALRDKLLPMLISGELRVGSETRSDHILKQANRRL